MDIELEIPLRGNTVQEPKSVDQIRIYCCIKLLIAAVLIIVIGSCTGSFIGLKINEVKKNNEIKKNNDVTELNDIYWKSLPDEYKPINRTSRSEHNSTIIDTGRFYSVYIPMFPGNTILTVSRTIENPWYCKVVFSYSKDQNVIRYYVSSAKGCKYLDFKIPLPSKINPLIRRIDIDLNCDAAGAFTLFPQKVGELYVTLTLPINNVQKYLWGPTTFWHSNMTIVDDKTHIKWTENLIGDPNKFRYEIFDYYYPKVHSNQLYSEIRGIRGIIRMLVIETRSPEMPDFYSDISSTGPNIGKPHWLKIDYF